jgi:hypothetical protein
MTQQKRFGEASATGQSNGLVSAIRISHVKPEHTK